jgi:hypothetical protein
VPQWKYTVNLRDIWRNEAMPFEQRRDKIVARIRASAWYRNRAEGILFDLVDELADAADIPAFDQVWSAIYDEADADRAWLTTC